MHRLAAALLLVLAACTSAPSGVTPVRFEPDRYLGTWYEQTFTVKPADRAAFLARTQLLGRLRNASFTDENYDVFVLW